MKNSAWLYCCCTALFLVSLAPCAAQEQRTLGYLPPGTPEVGGINDMVLIYHGRQSRVPWTKEALMPYVAYVDEQGIPQDWFFDSFLFIEFATDNGTWIHYHREDTPLPTIDDWVWLADGWFRPTTGLIGLEQAVAEVADKLGPADRKAKVVIGMPVPSTDDTAFGPLPGEQNKLDFSATDDRLQALQWYIQRVLDQWREHDYQHLELMGFYWTAEETKAPDYELIRHTSDYLHAMGYKLFQIPYSGDFSVWREIGFDAIMRHPWYYTIKNEEPPLANLLAAAKLARMYNTGIELELDGRVLTDEKFRERFIAAMDAGAHYGWMQGAMMSYYEGGGAVKQLAATPEVGRDLYRKLYEYVKGTYVPSGRYDFSDLPLTSGDNTGNLALATAGAKIHGAGARPEWGSRIGPQFIIDGNADVYSGMEGFGAFYWPGSFIIELPTTQTVARTQVMLFDLDGRFFRYQVHTSVDGENWQPAVNKDTGEWRGWQVDTFAPREARYVRFTGLFNSANSLFQVVEFGVYSDVK